MILVQHSLGYGCPESLPDTDIMTCSFNPKNEISLYFDSFITMHLEPANQKMFFVVNFQTTLNGQCKSI